jgi:uncharacterized protein
MKLQPNTTLFATILPTEATKDIRQKLADIEQQYNVHILYACESGSRAWGFPSPDSDFDVRFVYAHNPDFYLSIDDEKDVIEMDIDGIFDLSGWDVRKALRLFRGHNAALYEWLQSPIVYQKDAGFHDFLVENMPNYYSLRSGLYHYTSQAKGCYDRELLGSSVRLKKYFYALRPILAALWIAERKTVPPMTFDKLRVLLPSHLNAAVDNLLTIKVVSDEKAHVDAIPELNEFIFQNIYYCQTLAPDMPEKRGNTEGLNRLFRNSLAMDKMAMAY